MPMIKKLMVVAGIFTFVALPFKAQTEMGADNVLLENQEIVQEEKEKTALDEIMSKLRSVNLSQAMKEQLSADIQTLLEEQMATPVIAEVVGDNSSDKMTPKPESMMPMMDEMTAMQPAMMQPMAEQKCMPEAMEMMTEGMEHLLRSLVLLVDFDFNKRLIAIDVDFYRDEERMIDSLLMSYVRNPEAAEAMFNCVAERYMNEHGDEVIQALLKNFNVADVQMMSAMVKPFVQKALMGEMLKAMHRCIIFKGNKLQEMMA